MTTTYKELLLQAESIRKEAERVRKHEIQAVIRDIKTKIQDYSLSAGDLGLGPIAKVVRPAGKPRKAAEKKSVRRGKVPAKYRDPLTGKTWSGRGKTPVWIVQATSSGGSLNDFLIQAAVDSER